MKSSAFILDNGAYTAKLGFSYSSDAKIVPNCIMKAKSERRRPFIGNQIDDCQDLSGLFYILCFQKGYLTNWDIQKTVWDYMFSPDCCSVNFAETNLIITEPQFNLTTIQEAMVEIFFEEYECERMLKTTAADLAAYNYYTNGNNSLKCCVVIDIGYSFTHIVPFIKGKRIKEAIRRINVGGKLLTNHLKEIISYRQLNVMDESYVINQVKEDSCFVSENFYNDMKKAQQRPPDNTIIKDYVLPDFTTLRRGILQDVIKNEYEDHQLLRLNNERFSIPELLFHPSDVGIFQMGIPEATILSVMTCPDEAQPHLFANIIVCGGCALFPGIIKRLQTEIRSLTPDDMDVNVQLAKNPITYAWHGGVKLSKNEDYLNQCMTREEYEEEGSRIIFRK